MKHTASSPNKSSIASRERVRLAEDYIFSLCDREVRDRDGLYYVEGLRFANAALDAGAPIVEVAWCPKLARAHRFGEMAERLSQYPQRTLTDRQMADLSFSPEPQGIVLVLKQECQRLPRPGLLRPGAWVGIESLRATGNLGTILRSMAATGSPGIILFSHSGVYQDLYDPKVVRASMGGILGLQVVKTTYREFCRWTYRSEFQVLGADATGPLEHRAVSYNRPVLFMLGCERTGLTPGQLSVCDDLVRIPMAKHVDSLNVAMAATVLLFEAFHQRRSARTR